MKVKDCGIIELREVCSLIFEIPYKIHGIRLNSKLTYFFFRSTLEICRVCVNWTKHELYSDFLENKATFGKKSHFIPYMLVNSVDF